MTAFLPLSLMTHQGLKGLVIRVFVLRVVHHDLEENVKGVLEEHHQLIGRDPPQATQALLQTPTLVTPAASTPTQL